MKPRLQTRLPMYRFLFHHTANPIWISVLRRGTGGLLLASLMLLWPDFGQLYGLSGMVDVELLLLQRRAPGYSAYQLCRMLQAVGIAPELVLNTLCACYGSLCLLLLCNWQSRPVAAALLVLHTHLFLAVPAFSYGFDYFAASALFYCAVFPSKPNGHAAPVINFSGAGLRVLQVHLCLVYFFGGLDKLLGTTWRNGEALWKALSQPGFSGPLRQSIDAFAGYPPLWVAGGWGVIVVELAYALFIWPAGTRRAWLWATICLHLGIAWCMGLYLFAAMMILLNLVAFYFPYISPGASTNSHLSYRFRTAAPAGGAPGRAAHTQEASDV